VTIVLDSSATLAFCFEDERTPAIISVFEKLAEEGAVAPSLWRFEVANGLLIAQRRGRVTPAFRTGVLERLREAPIAIDDECNEAVWATTGHLADHWRLTVYDAAYLELAQRRRFPLATLDGALARAAAAAGVEVLG
jgi:predicted nucleic acid-binding protein